MKIGAVSVFMFRRKSTVQTFSFAITICPFTYFPSTILYLNLLTVQSYIFLVDFSLFTRDIRNFAPRNITHIKNYSMEDLVKTDLYKYLLAQGEIELHLPEAPDIEEKWQGIAQAYLPAGMRAFAQYPNVSLGWMMYTGMAVACLWDKDWETYGILDNLYTYLRDKRGYDCMDEYIRQEVLKLSGKAYDDLEKLVGECAARTNSLMHHQHIEPGTKEAFQAYVGCLHQMYLMGAAIWLKRMGYKMELL